MQGNSSHLPGWGTYHINILLSGGILITNRVADSQPLYVTMVELELVVIAQPSVTAEQEGDTSENSCSYFLPTFGFNSLCEGLVHQQAVGSAPQSILVKLEVVIGP